jgi:hypothetical protein
VAGPLDGNPTRHTALGESKNVRKLAVCIERQVTGDSKIATEGNG